MSLLCGHSFYLLSYRMHTKDQKILRFSMLLLFLALMIVYIVWYQVKGIQLQNAIQDQDSWSGIQIISMSWNEEIVNNNESEYVTWSLITGIIAETWMTMSGTKTTTGTMTKNTAITMLSGTSIYYGKIAIIEQLGIKYQYALTDTSGTWFIYLGTPSYDFTSITRALKGTIYTMATEQELIDNKLFGNKIVFINLPEYKDKQVIMLVYLNDGIRLIQMEYSLYHKSKWYLKSLFIDQ